MWDHFREHSSGALGMGLIWRLFREHWFWELLAGAETCFESIGFGSFWLERKRLRVGVITEPKTRRTPRQWLPARSILSRETLRTPSFCNFGVHLTSVCVAFRFGRIPKPSVRTTCVELKRAARRVLLQINYSAHVFLGAFGWSGNVIKTVVMRAGPLQGT